MNLFKNYQQVSKLFTVLLVLTGISIVIASIFTLLSPWLSPEAFTTNIGAFNFPIQTIANDLLLFSVYTSILNTLMMIAIFYTLFQLRKIFISFEQQNQVFTSENTSRFQKIGIFAFGSGLAYLIIKYGMGLFLYIYAFDRLMDENGSIVLQFNLVEILIIFIIPAIFLGLAEMFRRGIELKQDNDSIV